MKLKYYLKGFGIGVIFATLILSISFYSRKDSLNRASRQEIEQLAAAYGMVYPQETTTVKETETNGEMETAKEAEKNRETEKNQEAETTIEPITSWEGESTEEIKTSEGEKNTEETKTSEESGRIGEIETNKESESFEAESIKESQEIQRDTSGKEIIITVASGMYASSIAELLEEMEVIENAQEFSLYLIGEGYTRRLQAGVYTFTDGMDFKTIAGKLLWETE